MKKEPEIVKELRFMEKIGKIQNDNNSNKGIEERSVEGKLTDDRYRFLFENLNDGLILINKFGKVIDINKSALEMYGDTRENVVGKNFTKMGIFSSKDLPVLIKDIKKILSGEEIKRLVLMNSKNGEGRWLESSVKLTKQGKVAYVLVIARDITEKKRAQELLIKEKETAEKYLNLAGTAIMALDSNGSIILLNKKGCEILGYGEKELVGKNWFDTCLPKNISDDIKDVFKKLIAGDIEPVEFHENPVLRKDGNKRLIGWHNTILRNDEGNIIGTLSSGEDITEIKNAENQLKKAHTELQYLNKKLEEKVRERTFQMEKLLEQKDEFINMLSHDLKNPIGVLQNLISIVEDSNNDPKLKEIMQVCQRNVQNMKELITKTLELAEQSELGLKIKASKINLLEIINEVVSNNQVLFNENKIEVENKIKNDVIINADKTLLMEVLENIFSNAVKYSKDEPGKLVIDSSHKDDFATISIADTGIGISPEEIDHIFDEFYKTSNSVNDDSHGLGLAITKRIIDKHGGKIWAESSGIGKGTSIFFTLPSAS